MTEAAVQIQRFVYVEQLGTYTQDIDDVGKTYAIFKISRRRSSANEGVRVLLGRRLDLLAGHLPCVD